MIKLFSLRSFRLLSLGGAKARTNDDTGFDALEHDQVYYDIP